MMKPQYPRTQNHQSQRQMHNYPARAAAASSRIPRRLDAANVGKSAQSHDSAIP
jgi:hypothetical protein